MLPPGVRMHPSPSGYEYVETIVSLARQETGFGFRIVGGTEEGSQVGGMVRNFPHRRSYPHGPGCLF